MKRFLYILLFLLLSITIYAQRAPITVTTILTPPYTTSLSTMAESGSTRLMVNLLVNDVTITEIPVKLHIKMESAGITIESIPTQAVRPMFLGGGEARVLTGDDFAEYLNLNNLNFKGFSKEAYIKNGQLPAGLWKFSVSVRHFYTNKTISNIGTVTAWITSYKPPVLTSPKEGENAPSNAALPLTFSWQASKHTGGTAAIMYRFEMWERRIDGVPAQAVAASVPPIYTTETAGLTATVLPATLALEPGMKYCWRVTAYDPSGMVTVENNGESEVRTFQYLEKCPEVCGLTVDIKDDTGYASWEENRQHLGGYNFEFYDDEGTCHKTLWGSSTKTAGIGGEYGKTWHVRVQGLCRSSIEGPWSDWVDFKIPDAFKPLKDENGNTYECGREVPERVITNFELIDNIQKGDTLEDERGTTKYIIHSATKNEDGSFRGLSYMKLSIWGVKVLGEYNNMKVNTDGVIIGRYAWKSVKSDLLVADPEAIEKWADELALEMAGATYNNTIKDTIVLEYSKGYVRFETIRREGDKYFAVTSDNKDVEITSMINGKTRALVKDGDGHELVIDKDGNVMGVEEYTKCGGSTKLLSEHNAYRDSTMATSGNIKFSKVKDETYGLDEWRGADYDKDVYDNFNGYRPTYIGAQKQSNIKVAASQTKGIRFITERGVPIIANTADNTLNLAIGTAGKQTVYAYSDSTLVGKLCIQAYDPKEVKVHVVRVNNGKQLELNKIADEVNRIYSSAVVHYTFDELEPIEIEYANKKHFVHGGKGTFQNYNADQKAAIKALPKTADQNDYYLFFTDCYNRLDTAGNTSKEAVNGYMPVGRHYGFIYNEYTNARTIAHELGHGTNSLHHTFSQESESFYTTKETDNLMDYHAGEYLNHRQWQWAHEKHRNVLGFLDDEGESENVEKYVVDKFVVLLNKVYSHNNATCEDYYNKIKTDKVSKEFDLGFNSKRLEDAKKPQQEETETTAESTETVPEEGSDDSEDELNNVPDEDVKWLSEWAVRVLDATSIMKSIWEKIYDAKSNSKIQSLSINCNRVYITKITYKRNNDEKQYNVAIYNMTSSETLSGLQKMSINNLSDLNNESIKRYMYIDKSQSKKYWLLSFVENGKKENGKLVPSLVIQISGSCTDTDISNILESLGILKQLKEEDLTTELRDICYSFNNKEYITPTDKVQMTKDKILKVKGSNLCIYDNNAKVEENDINDALYTCAGSTGAMNWVDHFMTSDLDECPHIVRESDDNDYILEIVRAMKFAGQKGKKFSRKVDDKISKYGEMIALPNGKTISDVTLSINSKDLSFDINEDNIYESPEIREWTGKNNVMLGFGKKDGDKYPLEITCNWDCVKDLKEYIYDSKKENKSEFVPIERVISSDYHIKQDPGECLKACQKIVESAGFTYNNLNVMVLVTNVNGNNYDFHRDCVHKSIQVINESLENGKPVIVGVDYKDGSSNFDKVTDHWIVITARGKDEIGVYYSYFEVARETENGGVSNDNKLYLQRSSNILKGKCTCNSKIVSDYLVTMIRPVDDFSFKCCGREIYEYKKFPIANGYCKECEIEPGYYNKSDEQQSNIIIKP